LRSESLLSHDTLNQAIGMLIHRISTSIMVHCIHIIIIHLHLTRSFPHLHSLLHLPHLNWTNRHTKEECTHTAGCHSLIDDGQYLATYVDSIYRKSAFNIYTNNIYIYFKHSFKMITQDPPWIWHENSIYIIVIIRLLRARKETISFASPCMIEIYTQNMIVLL